MAIIAVDFDGTCVVSLPEPGLCEIDTGAEKVIKQLISAGHKIILWTCRNHSKNNPYNYTNGEFRENEDSLDEAIEWFKKRNIQLYGINKVPDETFIIGDSRKALYDLLIDDTSLGAKLIYGEVEYAALDTGEIKRTQAFSIDWKWVEYECKKIGLL